MIPQSFIQDLLNRLDIVDVVERYVPLKKAGANHVACCPFHSEKTPSFTVTPTKQFYHCFGCGAHGSAIGFVMEYNGMGFIEAVKELASSVGLKVPEERTQRAGPGAETGADLHEIMQQATRYYREQLKRSETAVAYLKKRGLTGEIAARFGLGYAPPGWQNLAAAFPGYQSNALLDAGLVIQGEDGKRHDRFRDRIMFPIVSQKGMIVGFGGRVLGEDEPKYLNSPETPLFEKGRELYGLFQARSAIRRAGRIVVVEGYMDVAALSQHGIEYCVATLGTATTAAHVQKLLRQTDTVIFCFDGDEAGRRAAWRALEASLAQLSDGKNVSFLFLPQGEDPDSYVRSFGRENFEGLLGKALPLSGFLLREVAAGEDLKTQESRARLLQNARPLLGQIAAPALNLMLRKRLAELSGITREELDELYQIKPAAASRVPQKPDRRAPSKYRKILELLVSKPELVKLCDGLPLPEESEAAGKILTALLEFLRDSPQFVNTAGVIQYFADTQHAALLGEIEREILQWGEAFDVEAELIGALEQIRGMEDMQLAKAAYARHASTKDLSPEERQRIRHGGRRPATMNEK